MSQKVKDLDQHQQKSLLSSLLLLTFKGVGCCKLLHKRMKCLLRRHVKSAEIPRSYPAAMAMLDFHHSHCSLVLPVQIDEYMYIMLCTAHEDLRNWFMNLGIVEEEAKLM